MLAADRLWKWRTLESHSDNVLPALMPLTDYVDRA